MPSVWPAVLRQPTYFLFSAHRLAYRYFPQCSSVFPGKFRNITLKYIVANCSVVICNTTIELLHSTHLDLRQSGISTGVDAVQAKPTITLNKPVWIILNSSLLIAIQYHVKIKIILTYPVSARADDTRKLKTEH